MKKVIILFLAIAATMVLLLTGRHYRQQDLLYEKMQDFWNIDWQMSVMERNTEKSIKIFQGPIYIENESIVMPLVEYIDDTVASDTTTWQSVDEMEQAFSGTWSIINCRPDSIQIDITGHPLSGKYEVTFRKEYFSKQDHFLMYLKNDSTELVCEKNDSYVLDCPKILENWEN